jgi:serine/threonine protein kinase
LFFLFFFCLQNGINPIKKKKLMNANELKDVFANIEPLVSFHEMFFSELDRCVGRWSKLQTIGDLFLKYSTGFNLYTEYINNFDKSDVALKKMLKKSKDLQKVEQELQNYPGVNRLDFSSFLIMPVQRLPRYLLLLDDLIKRTEMTHPDYNNILSAIRRVREISDHVNLQKGMSDTNQRLFELAQSLSGFPQESLLRPSRQLIDQKDVIIAGTKGIFSVSVVIFNDAYMIISKSAKGLTFIGMLPYKHSKLTRIPLEYARARLRVAGKALDLGKYTHWLLLSRSEEEDYFFSVSSESDAEAWIAQFDSLKGTILGRYFRRLETNFCPAARFSHTLTASYSNKLYMVGGSVKSAASREVWMLDYEQRAWTQLSVSGVPTITEHTTSLLGSRLLIFGGVVDGEYSNRLFSFDISTSTWAELSPQGQPPSSRSRHSAVVLGSRLYIFGGNVVDKSGAMAFFNDIHVYDSETNSWSMVVASRASDAPVARAGAAMVSRGTKIIVWGGAQGEVALNDLCIFDLIDSLWIQPRPVGFTPTPRHSVSVSVHDEYMLLYGGEVKGVPLSDLFVLNMDTLIWTKVRVPVQLPPRSRLPSILFSSAAMSDTPSPQNTSSSELRNTTLLFHGGRTEFADVKSYSDELVSLQLMDKWLMNEATINGQSDKVYQEGINKKKQKESEINVKLISYNFAQTSIANATLPFVFVPPARPGVDAWDGSVATISELAPLGRGTVGDTIKGTTSKAGTLAAIKKVALKTSDEAGLEARRRLATTVDNFKRSRHPNLATYYGVVQESEPQLWIVSELCAGSLKDYVSRSGACLNERQLATVAAQTLLGLQHLHQSGAAHRWLKASNVLVTERGEVKLSDYAIGDLLQQVSSADPSAVADAHSSWTSSDSEGLPAGDIYSLGVTLMELAENMPPFNDLFDPSKFSPEMQDFVRACTAPVAQRPDATMLLRHVFLNHARPDSLKEVAEFVRRHPLHSQNKAGPRASAAVVPPISGLPAAVVVDENVFKPITPVSSIPRAVSAPAAAPPPVASAAASASGISEAGLHDIIRSLVQAEVSDYKKRTDAVIASLQAQVNNIPALVDQKVAQALAMQPLSGGDAAATQAIVEAYVGQLRVDTEANVMNLFERIQILDAELLNLRNHLAALASSALTDV